MNLMKLPTTRDIVPRTAIAAHAFDSRNMIADGVWTYDARQTCTLSNRCAFQPTMAGRLQAR